MAKKAFTIDARTVLQLGRDSIKNPTTAVIELVKNGYDADANRLDVKIDANAIYITDNGVGMTADNLARNWLRIGYSEKKINKLSANSRRKTGEKGIGRLSADRLGSHLVIITKKAKHKAARLELDWDDFDVDGKDISDITIDISTQDQAPFPQGTSIEITNLRQVWTRAEAQQLYTELSSLVSPFMDRNDFSIIFSNHVIPELNGRIGSVYYELSDLSIRAKYDESTHELTYTIQDKSGGGSIEQTKSIPYAKLSHSDNRPSRGSLRCGPVNIELLFYTRDSSNPLLKAKDFSLQVLRDFLNNNSGIKIYRDDISVKPFGYNNEPAGDWLGLAQRKEKNPAGVGREDYKVSSHQLVGAVSISRDGNHELRDGAAREGFVENEAFNDLRDLVLSCVEILERYRHEQYIQQKKTKSKSTAAEKIEDYAQDIDAFTENLEKLSKKLDTEDPKTTSSTKNEIERFLEQADDIKQSFSDVLNENRVLRGLATIGISSAVFGHETQSAISLFKSDVNLADMALRRKSGPKIDIALESIASSKKAAEHVAAWGAFAVSRVKKDKRKQRVEAVDKILKNILLELADMFTSVNITIETQIEPIEARVFVMDIESIILNLLTNAYSFCGQSEQRIIRVSLTEEIRANLKGYVIKVADTGPGVDETLKTTIWEPLVSTKKDAAGYEVGTGLGLSIVSSTVRELYGEYSVGRSNDLGGAEFCIWLPMKN